LWVGVSRVFIIHEPSIPNDSGPQINGSILICGCDYDIYFFSNPKLWLEKVFENGMNSIGTEKIEICFCWYVEESPSINDRGLNVTGRCLHRKHGEMIAPR